jgi:hypothetical protein
MRKCKQKHEGKQTLDKRIIREVSIGNKLLVAHVVWHTQTRVLLPYYQVSPKESLHLA